MKYKMGAAAALCVFAAVLGTGFFSAAPYAQETGLTPSGQLPPPEPRSSKETTMPKNTTVSPPFSSHDYMAPLPLSDKSGLEYAVLAGGCFWCLEGVFELVPGVADVVSGYTGGTTARPSYEQVSRGETGHAEAVRIAFDPKKTSFQKLLEYFWKIHNPTTKDRQGYDIGTQYRSAIYYVGEDQRAEAAASMAREASRWPSPIVTQLEPAGDFWIAEEYHQDFFRRNPNYGYCAVVIAPKIKKAGFGQ